MLSSSIEVSSVGIVLDLVKGGEDYLMAAVVFGKGLRGERL
jgi:hypothetical protein